MSPSFVAIAARGKIDYFPAMLRLTRQEQLVLCIIVGLLLVGWAVKAWRTAHPPAPAAVSSQSEHH